MKNKDGKIIPGKNITLHTNQFGVRFSQDLSAFVYPIEIEPEPKETFVLYEVLNTLKNKIKVIFSPYLV